MTDTANQPCRTLVDVLAAQGLRDAVISPGSRNTPLIVALAARDNIRKHVIPDERTAAFAALGMALVAGKPVMLVCTSGTALYNYAPAVAEALYRKVPLIVVSADRPERWIDQDDSQTLRQHGALANIVKRSFNIAATEGMSVSVKGSRFENEQEWYVNRLANEAWITAVSQSPGPVHVNIQLDNPLGRTADIIPKEQRTVTVERPPVSILPSYLRSLAERIIRRKVLVVAGFMNPDNAMSRAVDAFASLPNVAVCSEPLANLHFHADNGNSVIDLVLAGASAEVKERLRPDIVISVGGSLVSRMLKEFIREYQPAELWTLGDTDAGVDCFQSLTTHFETSPAKLFKGLANAASRLSGRLPGMEIPAYAGMWKEIRGEAMSRLSVKTANAPWSDYTALMRLFEAMPSGCNLFLSNGTPVRYAGLAIGLPTHACHCNRGVSGIEGGNATAAGAAMKYSGTTLLVSGDMSFGYCPQILGLDGLPDSFRIVVVNNSGGGIFRFIATTRDLPQREHYFCAPTYLPLDGLCKAYGWEYRRASDMQSLDTALAGFFSGTKKLLEIATDPETSAQLLRSILQPAFSGNHAILGESQK